MTEDFREMLAHVTGGRRYCFVIMPFGEGFDPVFRAGR